MNLFIITVSISLLLSSCTLFGYDLQEDYKYNAHTLNRQTNKTVMEYLQSRPDIFSSMLQAIQYAGLDTLYAKTGNTYLLLTNNSLSNLENKSSYFYLNKVVNPAAPTTKIFGSSWNNYDTTIVREFLKYHVVKGTFSFNQLTATRVWASTYATGDTCKMSFVLLNDANGLINIQNNSDNVNFNSISPRTAAIECTNSGAVHVMDKYVNPPSKIQLGLK